MSDGVTWIEVKLTVPETDPLRLEPVDEACLSLSPGGFVMEGDDAPPGDDPPPPRGWSRYRVYVGEAQLEGAKAALAAVSSPFPGAIVEHAPLDDGWRERWKAYFEPIEVSDRLLVAPPWREIAPKPGQHVIWIEPAMAFGTGQHETTQLCLQGVDGLAAAGTLPETVLDVGTGTGVLALAAAHLGALRVVGVDTDPQAVAASIENVGKNPVSAAWAFSDTPVGAVEGTFGLVLANIMAHVLIALVEPIAARVAPGGVLMLSGVLVEQAADVIAAYEAHGLAHRHTEPLRGWVRIDLARP